MTMAGSRETTILRTATCQPDVQGASRGKYNIHIATMRRCKVTQQESEGAQDIKCEQSTGIVND